MMKAVTRTTGLFLVVTLLTNAGYAQDKNVTFQLDLNPLIDFCAFDVSEDIASVNGTFNDWTAAVDTLTDADEDGIYSKTIAFSEDDTLAYKFWLEPATLGWEDGDDRIYIVGADTDQTLEVASYNKTISDLCGVDTFPVEVAFQVNLGPQILAGEFSPGEQEVLVAGPFSDWGASTDTLVSQAGINDSLYANFVAVMDFAAGDSVPYKFITKDEAGTIGWENLDPDTPQIEGNRFFVITGNEIDSADEDTLPELIIDEQFYGDLSYDELVLFSQEATITLEVDARPAYYFLADSSFLPSDTQSGDSVFTFTSLFANGPYIAGDWVSWGPDGLGAVDSLELVDDGTGGDVTAGDSIFTMQFVKPANGIREGVIKFGIDGWDNEAGLGADRVVLVEDSATPTISTVFGLVRQSDGKLTDDKGPNGFELAWDQYILVDNGTNPPSAQVVRRGGDADGTNTAVEAVGDEVPSTITLKQNYPNPFNPTTTFEYTINDVQDVKLAVYDIVGRRVALLVDGVQPASTYRVSFDATDLASGTYFYRLEAAGTVLTKTMVLIK